MKTLEERAKDCLRLPVTDHGFDLCRTEFMAVPRDVEHLIVQAIREAQKEMQQRCLAAVIKVENECDGPCECMNHGHYADAIRALE